MRRALSSVILLQRLLRSEFRILRARFRAWVLMQARVRKGDVMCSALRADFFVLFAQVRSRLRCCAGALRGAGGSA